MPPHSRKTAEGPPIEMSEYDETRATARLPNLDIEILHRRPWEGNEEHLMVTLRAVPSFEAFGRLFEVSNPLLVWTRMMEAAWSPWVRGISTALAPSVRPPSLPGFDPGSHGRADRRQNRFIRGRPPPKRLEVDGPEVGWAENRCPGVLDAT